VTYPRDSTALGVLTAQDAVNASFVVCYLQPIH
jgi:hypothetical protein